MPQDNAELQRIVLPVTKDLELPNGDRLHIELGSLAKYVDRIVFGFYSLGAFVKLVSLLAKHAQEHSMEEWNSYRRESSGG